MTRTSFLSSFGVLGLLNVLALLHMGYGLYAIEKPQLPSMASKRNRFGLFQRIRLAITSNVTYIMIDSNLKLLKNKTTRW